MLLDSKRTVDPRDNLDKAHRRELVEFAKANGVEVDENMPADDIEGRPGTGLRGLLRAKGLTRIAIPHRNIDGRVGDKTFPLKQAAPPAQASSDEWAEFQKFKAWKAQQSVEPKPVEKMSMKELRAECKARGVKMDRTDTMEALRAKLQTQ